MLAEGRGEGKVVFIRYLCYNGELGGRGLGINLLHFGEEGGGPLTTTINISPIHLSQFSKDGSNFS